MLRTTTIACSLAATTLLAGAAAADGLAPAPVRFTSLAPDGMRSEVDARLGVHHLDGATETLFSFQLEGAMMAPTSGGAAGGYARVAAAKVQDSNAIGDLELGGLYRIDRGDALSIALRGGVVLPTATDGEDGFVNAVAVLMARPSDLMTAASDITALRLSVAPTYRSGLVVARADVGLDIAVITPDDRSVDPIYHADVAVGLQQGQGAVTAELSTVGSTGSSSSDDGTFHAFSLGAQYDTGAVTPSVTLALPFASTDGLDLEGYTLLAGISGRL